MLRTSNKLNAWTMPTQLAQWRWFQNILATAATARLLCLALRSPSGKLVHKRWLRNLPGTNGTASTTSMAMVLEYARHSSSGLLPGALAMHNTELE